MAAARHCMVTAQERAQVAHDQGALHRRRRAWLAGVAGCQQPPVPFFVRVNLAADDGSLAALRGRVDLEQRQTPPLTSIKGCLMVP